jgi:hypothetical protein
MQDFINTPQRIFSKKSKRQEISHLSFRFLIVISIWKTAIHSFIFHSHFFILSELFFHPNFLLV